ncbi:MAG: cytidylate kinase-like family protein [Porphyromonadaceae bacterium]|nr:cytidylate kinase-like family protein [Porphyromonadaceae bacterium]
MEKNFIITVGRQFGSGGKEISHYLSQFMGIKYYDKELIQEAAKESGIDPRHFEKADETSPSGLYNVLFGISSFQNEGALCHENIFKFQANVIRNIADNHSCVIVGRCADYILRENPRCISVFIHADMEDRIDRILKNEPLLSRKEAMEKALKIDKRRASYYNFYSDKEWGVASSYNLSVNSSILGTEETANLICNFVQKRLDLLNR